MTDHRAMLCRTCARPAQNAELSVENLQSALADLPKFSVSSVDCMSGCTRPATIAFRAPGKTAYLFGDISAADLDDLCIFARLYFDSPDGTFADARSVGALRHKAIARIPAST